MWKRLLILLAVLASGLLPVNAAELLLVDPVTKEPIPEAFALVKLFTPEAIESRSGTTKDGVIAFSVPSGQYDAHVFVDVLDTPGKDYYARALLAGENKLMLGVLPVASLTGRALSDAGVVATSAKLSFDCDKDYGIEYPLKTDAVGYFSVAYMPIGACRVQARLGSRYGVQEVVLRPGEKQDVLVRLDQEVPGNWLSTLVLAVVIAGIAVALFLARKRLFKRRKKEVNLEGEELQAAIKIMRMTDKATLDDIKKDDRIQGVLKTLNKDERAIVDFLIQHKFKATQPQIFKATLIPKTTIARRLMQLAARNVVLTRQVRKVKEAELTDWFLGEHK
jgi:uncharacterized membrane protein